mmetsp:Transcript_40932/g.47207  ORF Transcript_40932/g.47207 Transcript_40932/m.47207 type:complete len:224 (+) Transcript_40932:690-1361(+)
MPFATSILRRASSESSKSPRMETKMLRPLGVMTMSCGFCIPSIESSFCRVRSILFWRVMESKSMTATILSTSQATTRWSSLDHWWKMPAQTSPMVTGSFDRSCGSNTTTELLARSPTKTLLRACETYMGSGGFGCDVGRGTTKLVAPFAVRKLMSPEPRLAVTAYDVPHVVVVVAVAVADADDGAAMERGWTIHQGRVDATSAIEAVMNFILELGAWSVGYRK